MKTRIAKSLLVVCLGLIGPSLPLAAQDAAVPPPTGATPATPALPEGAQPAGTAIAKTIDASADILPEDADGIAATVNDESITNYDLRQRTALFVATSGLNPSPDDLKRIRSQVLEKLEDEKIQLQEAQRNHITVSPVEVDKAISNLLGQNHLTMEQLRNVLSQAGSSDLAMRTQITAQIAWQKTVQDRYSGEINISQAQVDAEVQRYADGAAKPHFLVNEIFLPVNSPEQDAAVLKNAQGIHDQIMAGASFQAVAHQFSQNPAAAQGGAIGWVHEGQLSAELNSALVLMKPGELSSPIRAAGGYYLLNLQARQEPLGTKIANVSNTPSGPEGTLPLARLLLPLGANPTKDLIAGATDAAMQIHNGFNGCDRLKDIADKMKGSVYMDLGNMKVADLSPEIQKALSGTPSGETTIPLQSDAGVELIARCDKKIETQTAFVMPTRDQVEEELFNEQISALAQRYLRDLKRDANVEVR